MKKIDRAFLNIDSKFPFYSWLIPVNAEEEKKNFLHSSTSYNPQFKYNYNSAILEELKKELNNINIPDTLIGKFYSKLRKEYLQKIRLIKNIGNPVEFTEISEEIYGSITDNDSKFADSVLESYSDDGYKETVDAREIKNELEKELIVNNIKRWQVVLENNIASKVTVKPTENTVYIKGNYKFFPAEAERLKVHEIQVHVLRAVNGENQEFGIFKRGFSGYLETEEGLAVYFENKRGVCDPQQMKVYAGRFKAAESALCNSFNSTFEILRKWFPPEIAFRLCARVKRGITDTSGPGALTKDIHYITGYLKIRHLYDADNVLDELFTGKVGVEDIDDIRILLDKGIIKRPFHKP